MRRPVDPRRDFGGLLTLRIFEVTKPVIAAINGPAVGIGATMTLPMDIRLASDSARFGFVFAARGIVPEAASSWFLPRLVGIQQALEWCYTARVFPLRLWSPVMRKNEPTSIRPSITPPTRYNWPRGEKHRRLAMFADPAFRNTNPSSAS